MIVCSLKSGSLDSAKTPVEPLTFSKAGLFEETYSPLPPSPFNTDPSNNDDVDGGKDSSISSIQTASSDYDNRVSLPKVDDSKLGYMFDSILTRKPKIIIRRFIAELT